jgi:hypothetical protein
MKNELEKASVSEILDAIRKKGHNMYIGLIDQDGMESMVLVEDFKEFQTLYSSLSLRARLNAHRSPVLYSVMMVPDMYEVFNEKLLKGSFKEVASTVEKLSTYKVLGF